MKILAIRGRNIASLEGDFAIDFTTEPLLSAGIFAISGPTGSGKSTLLDTMCLALFGCTPRTEQAKEKNVKLSDAGQDLLMQGDPRFLLRRGTGSGYAEVDFLALDGHRYRARWSVARARERASGRLQSVSLSLKDLNRDCDIPGKRSELQAHIIQLIGLTFDQFTRSVLLAQNDFSTFLKADQSDKAALLEKLTGTEQYSQLSKLIYAKSNEAREAYEQVQARIEGIELLDEEQEKNLQNLLAQVEKEALQWEKLKSERQGLCDQLRTTTEQQSAKLKQQQEAEIRLAESLRRLEAARNGSTKTLDKQQELEKAFKKLQPELQQARRLDTQIESEQRRLTELRKASDNARKQHEENVKKLLHAQKQCETDRNSIANLTTWREKMAEKAPIAEQLEALLLHIDSAASANRFIEQSATLLEKLHKQHQAATQELEHLNSNLLKLNADLQQVETNLKGMNDRLSSIPATALRASYDQQSKEREHLLIEQARRDIKELRAQLQEGEPCPVCGSTQHPFRLLAADTVEIHAERIKELTLSLETLRKQLEEFDKTQTEANKLSQQQVSLQKQLNTAESNRQKLRSEQELTLSRIEQEEKNRAEQSHKLQQSLEAANQLFGNEEWQKNWKQDDAQFRIQLVAFAKKWNESNNQLQVLKQQQSGHTAEYNSLLQFQPALEKALKEAEQEWLLKEKETLALRQERARLLNGKHADLIEQEAQAKLEAVKKQLLQLQEIQSQEIARSEQSRGTVRQITSDLTELKQRYKESEAALSRWEKAWQEQSPEKSLDDTLAENTLQRNETAFKLRTQADNRLRVARWQKELEDKRLIADRWAKLNELVGSSDGGKFRKIAQGYTLDVLLSYANVQLRNLTHRYKLQRVADTLALQVIDRDMCDEVRTVHTLSGGESFLVSLALALGLSSLSSNRMKVESLFIDEGFGSLDSETLRIAMEALENLRTQGRKIGVISHVQEMTERIPVQIRVSRNGNGRSSIQTLFK